MNTDMILKSDVLDILFENRNKLYGAYPLRKFYPDRIKTSLVIMLGVVLVFCLFAVIPKSAKEKLDVITIEDAGFRKINPDKNIPDPKKTPPAQKTIFNSQKFISTIKMEKDSADKLPADLDNIPISNITITNGVDGSNVTGQEEGQEHLAEVVKEAPEPDLSVPVENPEVEPSYPGGINALRTFLQKNLTNPRDLDEGEQVSVQIKFIVGYDGKLQRFETVKDGGAEFNNEVIRVLKKMPQWIAGKSNGKNVSVYYTIPVKFVPND